MVVFDGRRRHGRRGGRALVVVGVFVGIVGAGGIAGVDFGRPLVDPRMLVFGARVCPGTAGHVRAAPAADDIAAVAPPSTVPFEPGRGGESRGSGMMNCVFRIVVNCGGGGGVGGQ